MKKALMFLQLLILPMLFAESAIAVDVDDFVITRGNS